MRSSLWKWDQTSIYVTSCQRDRHKQTAIRETWGQHCSPVFFLGTEAGYPIYPDEVIVDAPDDYEHIPWKALAMCQRAYKNLTEWLFVCAIDTFVDVENLRWSGFERYAYTGHRCDEGHASGGNGYWLSRDALKIIADKLCAPRGYEDLWIGTVLAEHGIKCHHDPRYGNGVISRHLGTGTGRYDPADMYLEYGRRNKWTV